MGDTKVMHKPMNISLGKAFFFAFIVSILAVPLRADTPLEEQMDVMRGAFRSIKAAMEQPVDADKEKYAAFADKLRAAAVKSKDLEPEKLATVPDNERGQFLADYRESMDKLIALIDQLKAQITAGDWDAARAQIKLINRAQGNGHEKFRSEKS